jgi:putative FmdB family regulatory protein
LYEYECGGCGRFEIIQKFSDQALQVCPTCGGEVQKLLSACAIQFKGAGWYVNDYARKPSGGDGGRGSEPSSSSGEGKGASKDGSSTPNSSTSKDSSATGSSPSK